MSRLIKWVLVVAILAGGLAFLSSQATEQPLTRHEKQVSLDALQK